MKASEIDLESLRESLGRPVEGPCVSLYMPAHPAADDQEDQIRFKNLLNRAETQLEERGLGGREARDQLEPLRALLADSEFWRHQRQGLAGFASPDGADVLRLPLPFEEQLVVGPRPHLGPLVPLLGDAEGFFVLALSRGSVRLLSATRDGQRDITPDSLPKSLEEALAEDDPERRLQLHSAAKGSAKQGNPAIFHGTVEGAGSDEEGQRDQRYLRRIAKQLDPILARGGRPVVLAGVQHILATFRAESELDDLIEAELHGNPDQRMEAELREEAWPLVEARLAEGSREAIEAIEARLGTGEASTQIETIVPAAYQGWVEELVLARGRATWGRFDPSTHALERSDVEDHESVDLLGQAAVDCLRQGGRVHLVEGDRVPQGAAAAARFRFAVPIARAS